MKQLLYYNFLLLLLLFLLLYCPLLRLGGVLLGCVNSLVAFYYVEQAGYDKYDMGTTLVGF